MKKTGRSVLSVMLSLLLIALPLCGLTAFAEGGDGCNWAPIPTSPDGLPDGAYYLDFTDWLTLSAENSDPQWTDEALAAAITAYNGGTWYFDADALKLKGTITEVNPETGTTETAEYTAETGTYLLDCNVLREAGATWTKMEKCTTGNMLDLEVLGVVNGDLYVDVSGADAVGLGDIMREAEFYVNPNSTLMRYKIVFGVNAVYLPLQDVHFGSWLTVCPVKTYDDGCTWTLMPKSTDGLSDGEYYIDVQGYVDILVDENGDPLSDEAKQAELQIWGNADYYVDLDQMKLKATLYLPYVDDDGNETTVTQYLPSYAGDVYIPVLLKQVVPCPHAHTATSPETAPTATAHGYTEGVYCEDCDTWLSGHEVIHNTLGERTILQEPTATEAGSCIIVCTVCGESGLYAMEPVPAPETPEDEAPLSGIRKAIASVINFFLRLMKWLSGMTK